MTHDTTQLKRILAAAIIFVSSFMPVLTSAQQMNSANYSIPFQALGGGGDNSTSTNYGIEDTLAELGVNATGEDATSANYQACAGYQCLEESGFLSVTFAVQSSACSGGDDSTPPYSIPMGTLSTGSVTTASNHICVTVTANAGGGVVVTDKGANGGLASTSVPADIISSATTTLAAGSSGFGICVTNAANGFSASAPYDGTCNTSSGHDVGGVATVDQTVLTASSPVNTAYGDILTKASISSTVPAHDDYAETLTLTVTGTY